MLLQLLALAAVAVQGADPGDALTGTHRSSIELFALADDNSRSLVGQLNDVFGGDTVAEMSGEMCAHMLMAVCSHAGHLPVVLPVPHVPGGVVLAQEVRARRQVRVGGRGGPNVSVSRAERVVDLVKRASGLGDSFPRRGGERH